MKEKKSFLYLNHIEALIDLEEERKKNSFFKLVRFFLYMWVGLIVDGGGFCYFVVNLIKIYLFLILLVFTSFLT